MAVGFVCVLHKAWSLMGSIPFCFSALAGTVFFAPFSLKDCGLCGGFCVTYGFLGI